MLTQIKNKYKSDDISVCILGSVKEHRELTRSPVIFSKVSHYKLLDLQIDAIKNVFPKCKLFLTLPEIKKKLYKEIYGNISVIENTQNQGNGLEIKMCLDQIKSDRVLFVDSSCIFDEYTLIQLVGKNSCTIMNKKSQKNRQLVSSSGSSILHHLSFGLPHQWSKILLLDNRELRILQGSYKSINDKMEFYETVNLIIDKGGRINIMNHNRGLLGHVSKGDICVF